MVLKVVNWQQEGSMNVRWKIRLYLQSKVKQEFTGFWIKIPRSYSPHDLQKNIDPN